MSLQQIIKENNIKIGLWEIEESLEELLQLANTISTADFNTEKRKKEWIASRLLLNEINPNYSISYNAFGAPELNNDGTKNTLLDFFTAERKQTIPEGNTTHIRGNPVLGIYMNGDVYEMARMTGGKANRYRYFLKQIKVALRETAKVEATTFSYNGKEYKGEKVFFTPYVEDPHRRDFEIFADKYYEIIFSDDIPGKLYQITTIIPDKSNELAEPLLMETLRLIDVKQQDS